MYFSCLFYENDRIRTNYRLEYFDIFHFIFSSYIIVYTEVRQKKTWSSTIANSIQVIILDVGADIIILYILRIKMTFYGSFLRAFSNG